jgi:hypothetical protein
MWSSIHNAWGFLDNGFFCAMKHNQYIIQHLLCVIHYLRRVSASACFGCGAILRVSLQQRYISQLANLCSAPLYRYDWNLKLLKYMKLITINYSIMILSIKVCNTKPPQLPVFIFFNIMWQMYTNIGFDFVWFVNILSGWAKQSVWFHAWNHILILFSFVSSEA